jgi:hypothetical protein
MEVVIKKGKRWLLKKLIRKEVVIKKKWND